MSVAIVTGSAGLVGSETCRRFACEGLDVVGIDNDMRAEYFGPEGSTTPTQARLQNELPAYSHRALDIRDAGRIEAVFQEFGSSIAVVIHCAGQPSHDWAAGAPQVDFAVNALGTLNLLEAARTHCPDAPFIFTSTNKVYGETPNALPLQELETRWEIAPEHHYAAGINETMSIDQTKHSLFGVSKVSADVMVQEYGRYYGMHTACFRAGCISGPAQAGMESHGFLAYLMKCTATGRPYRIYGYQGKQVRDNLHSEDLAKAFWEFFRAPRAGEVYNIGGGRRSNCSMREAIALCEEISGRKLDWTYEEKARSADHIWWISDTGKFESHYPAWKCRRGIREILEQVHAVCAG